MFTPNPGVNDVNEPPLGVSSGADMFTHVYDVNDVSFG